MVCWDFELDTFEVWHENQDIMKYGRAKWYYSTKFSFMIKDLVWYDMICYALCRLHLHVLMIKCTYVHNDIIDHASHKGLGLMTSTATLPMVHPYTSVYYGDY